MKRKLSSISLIFGAMFAFSLIGLGYFGWLHFDVHEQIDYPIVQGVKVINLITRSWITS